MPCVAEQTRLCIKNILLSADVSESSQAILSYVVGLAQRYSARLSSAGMISPAAICEIVREFLRSGRIPRKCQQKRSAIP